MAGFSFSHKAILKKRSCLNYETASLQKPQMIL